MFTKLIAIYICSLSQLPAPPCEEIGQVSKAESKGHSTIRHPSELKTFIESAHHVELKEDGGSTFSTSKPYLSFGQ